MAISWRVCVPDRLPGGDYSICVIGEKNGLYHGVTFVYKNDGPEGQLVKGNLKAVAKRVMKADGKKLVKEIKDHLLALAAELATLAPYVEVPADPSIDPEN